MIVDANAPIPQKHFSGPFTMLSQAMESVSSDIHGKTESKPGRTQTCLAEQDTLGSHCMIFLFPDSGVFLLFLIPSFFPIEILSLSLRLP